MKFKIKYKIDKYINIFKEIHKCYTGIYKKDNFINIRFYL